ncbi:type II toxin-antitoxin system HicA family toxin [Rhodococcus sp. BH5]|uniref:type II toxin-antitoxin system HicA family toxin n=1 Tax=Rhodococcus sp. BH5 TaxID=2871702 RepID=UPI0022CDBAD4|nr:type II toxin-antitoxin system HicA family toxin [Rhodococcus sp. BH5]MCZ9635298.1 type II toxin-antitoxin system HicA family toxin [Rhodococcus sp. BH5]
MVADQLTRKVVKELKTAGSHTTWKSENGKVHVSVPDGHRTISPGVYRKVLKAIQEAKA